MDIFRDLLKEISTKHYFLNITLIDEINSNIYSKLLNLMEQYNETNNKYLFMSGLVRLGYELEKSININSNDILSLQLNNISGLIYPIINKIKKICYELNLELAEELKKYIFDLINEEQILYLNIKKNIKFLNIICFCRNVNFVVNKELLFDDFGIVIKISNPHYKNIFTDLITKIGIFTLNDNKDKRFDWYWKPLYNYDLNELLNYKLKEENNLNSLTADENNSNINNTNSDEKIEQFKIVQKIPENNIGLYENRPIEKFTTISELKEQSLKILSNSIIIEDDSFSIPIDNTNYR